MDLAFPSSPAPIAATESRLASPSDKANSSDECFQMTSDTDVSMQFFVCRVGTIEITGCFYRVEFQDGATIDFAVVKNEDGKLVAMAARDPVKEFIWVQPIYEQRSLGAATRLVALERSPISGVTHVNRRI